MVLIAISHNMDNINPVTQGELAKYMGLTKTKAGANATQADLSDAFSDASNSKQMEVDQPQTGHIRYIYRRGGVQLIADIDVGTQKITWEQHGLTTQSDQNRIDALAQGLKLAQSSDLGTAATAPTWT